MAKFKRYDPRNKKAESKQFTKQFDKKRSRLLAQQHNETKRNRNNEKNLYSFEEEFDL